MLREPEPSEAPPPPPPDREAWIERVRLFHFIHTVSSLHFGEPHQGFEGDARRGRFFRFDGSGNHLSIGWSEAGVVAFAYDHDMQPEDPEAAPKYLPKELRAFGRKLAAWMPPVGDVAWYSVASGSGGSERLSDGLDDFVGPDEAKRLARWQESASISDAQLALALSLTRASATSRHRLTAAEEAVLLAPPEEGGAAPDRRWREPVRRHLAAAGVDWVDTDAESVKH